MSLTLVTPAEALPIDVADAKVFARIDNSNEDALIETLILAATEHVQQVTGRQFVTATYKLTLRCFPDGVIRLPRSPLISVDTVEYRDTDGMLDELEPLFDYFVDSDAEPATIEPVTGWPTTQDVPDAVQITFTAGYAGQEESPADPAANVPARAKVAVLALTAHWYDQREPVAVGVNMTAELPLHVSRLITGLRVWGAY